MADTKRARELGTFSQNSYDLIIVGGGIYGVMLSYEASRRGLRPLMLEKNDFAGATSLNHLRTVHGGLRYLQKADIPRFLESVGERKWFLQYFPEYVKPMPCLMPLYGKGLHRNMILRAALLLNDFLSFNRNKGVTAKNHLHRGRVVSPDETKTIFPDVDTKGLTGGAVWYDASVREYQRLNFRLLEIAMAAGAAALNYIGVKELLTENNRVVGVRARDEESGNMFEFRAPVVINASGPWSRETAAVFHKDHEPLFKKRLLLWNVMFKRDALSGHALALNPVKGKGRSYFFHPWNNRLLVGTGELVVEKSETETRVPDHEMAAFIRDINIMAPQLNLKQSDIQRVYSGVLPATDAGGLSGREVIHLHASNGGPDGLVSLSGVKFTTSRLVAEKVMKRLFPDRNAVSHEIHARGSEDRFREFPFDWEPSTPDDLEMLKEIIANESVVHLDDLVLRRTSLGDNPERAIKILPQLKKLFNWDEGTWDTEVDTLERELFL